MPLSSPTYVVNTGKKLCVFFWMNVFFVLKSRDITLPTKVCIVKVTIFPVIMHGCESWTIKKAERRRIDAFELWCWRRLLRVTWRVRRSSQSILKEISPEYSLEEVKLKLKLQSFATWCDGLTHWKRPWGWERLRAGGKGGDRGWDSYMVSLTQCTWVWENSGTKWRTGNPSVLQFMRFLSQTQPSDWTTATSE